MSAVKTTIPRVLHQIWIGPDSLPAEFAKYRETWMAHHPDWTFHLWTDQSELPVLINQGVFDAAESYAEKADVLRLELILRHGGMYVDADYECLKNVDPLIAGASALFPKESSVYFTNNIFAARPGHPLVAILVEAIRQAWKYQDLGKTDPSDRTGPKFFTNVLPPWLETGFFPDVRVLEGPPTDYAIHHFAGSWLK